MDTQLVIGTSDNFSRLLFKVDRLFGLFYFIWEGQFQPHDRLSYTFRQTVTHLLERLQIQHPTLQVHLLDEYTYNDMNESIVAQDETTYTLEVLVEVDTKGDGEKNDIISKEA